MPLAKAGIAKVRAEREDFVADSASNACLIRAAQGGRLGKGVGTLLQGRILRVQGADAHICEAAAEDWLRHGGLGTQGVSGTERSRGSVGAAGAELTPQGPTAASRLHDCVGGAGHEQRIDHVLPGRSVNHSAGTEETVLERVQVAFTRYILQEVGREHAGVHALGHRDLCDGLPAP